MRRLGWTIVVAVVVAGCGSDASDGTGSDGDVASTDSAVTDVPTAADSARETTADSAPPEDSTPDTTAETGPDTVAETTEDTAIGEEIVAGEVIEGQAGAVHPDFELALATLTWTADPPLPDTAPGPDGGVDLSLHLMVSTRAEGFDIDDDRALDGWFDIEWDCFWQNLRPEWGASIDIDDVCCGGPENVSYEPNGALGDEDVLMVGVEVWSMGDAWTSSAATVTLTGRDGTRIEIVTSLADGQFWEVARVSRDGVTILDDGSGGLRVFEYSKPF